MSGRIYNAWMEPSDNDTWNMLIGMEFRIKNKTKAYKVYYHGFSDLNGDVGFQHKQEDQQCGEVDFW